MGRPRKTSSNSRSLWEKNKYHISLDIVGQSIEILAKETNDKNYSY